MTAGLAENNDAVHYRVTRMDCPLCVAKIEGAARKLPGVPSAILLIPTTDPCLVF